MADRKISELTNITGANLADTDEFVVVDTSASETKAITYGELKKFTGTVTADGLTVDGTSNLAASVSNTTNTAAYHGLRVNTANTSSLTYPLYVRSNNLNRLIVHGNGDISFYEDTGTTPKLFWDASAESLVLGDVGAGSLQLNHDGTYAYIQSYGSTPLRINKLGNNVLFCEDGGNVGIGTSSPASALDVVGTVTADGLTVDGGGSFTQAGGGLRVLNNGTAGYNANIFFGVSNQTDGWSLGQGIIANDGVFRLYDNGAGNVKMSVTTGGDISFYEDTGTTPKFFWDASAESLGIGTSSPVANTPLTLEGPSGYTDTLWLKSVGTNIDSRINIAPTGTGNAQINNSTGTAIEFQTSGTERMRIDSSGNVGIGVVPESWYTAFSTKALQLGGTTSLWALSNGSTDLRTSLDNNLYISFGGSNTYLNTGPASRYQQLNGQHIWSNAASGTADTTATVTERMRINSDGSVYWKPDGTTQAMTLDASGNLLVGKTSADGGVNGFEARSAGETYITTTSTTPLAVNRKTSDGALISFSKDGTTVGVISSQNSGDLAIGQTFTGFLFNDAANNIIPFDPTNGSSRDNIIDLGASSHRFDDIYATNALIQTSDRNEKQDIAELDEAERRVAVAAKGLLRKFRWRDAVAEKGDDARIHFGIIAQDLQAAFAAEGLDAGKYAMFIHTTWTDEETGEERSRMGVRYSELLAFIIAAI